MPCRTKLMPTRRKNQSDLETLINELRNLVTRISTSEAGDHRHSIVRAMRGLEELSKELAEQAKALDPIQRPKSVFDPSDPNTSGRVVSLTLVAQDRHPLGEVPHFYGSGVYAIYYRGAFEAYAPLARKDHPIYVGKADPEDPNAKEAVSQGTKLSDRLREHAKNIARATTTLRISDFDCRFLIVQSGFQKAAEDYLINFFKPIWNSETRICHGLGKHGDDAGTRANKRSPWDTLHPGRAWADATEANQIEPEVIRAQIARHLATYPPYQDIHAIFDHIIETMRQVRARAASVPE